jgi:hypothetical protein
MYMILVVHLYLQYPIEVRGQQEGEANNEQEGGWCSSTHRPG